MDQLNTFDNKNTQIDPKNIPRPDLTKMVKKIKKNSNDENIKPESKENTPISQKNIFNYFSKKKIVENRGREHFGIKIGKFEPIEMKPGMFFGKITKNRECDLNKFYSEIFKRSDEILVTDIIYWKNVAKSNNKENYKTNENNIRIFSKNYQNNDKSNIFKVKFLKFSENYRPPYYGTWSKTSKIVRPRNPFGLDPIFDYEVQSDLEWEEEEPGEDLQTDSNSEEEESSDDSENTFIVPPGYISEDEGIHDSQNSRNSSILSINKDCQDRSYQEFPKNFDKCSLKCPDQSHKSYIKSSNFNEKNKFKKLKPVFHCFCSDLSYLTNYKFRKIEYPIQNTNSENFVDLSMMDEKGLKISKQFPDDLICELIPICHKNTSLIKIVEEFKKIMDDKFPLKSKLSASLIKRKIQEISTFQSKKYMVSHENLIKYAPQLLESDQLNT